jgi:Abnormal spindle-like microcephaly-assoc'd, ASPM-SPD-2-Hydin
LQKTLLKGTGGLHFTAVRLNTKGHLFVIWSLEQWHHQASVVEWPFMNRVPSNQIKYHPLSAQSNVPEVRIRGVALGVLTVLAFSLTGCVGATISGTLVSTQPLIMAQPEDQQVAIGQQATFSVTAEGSAPIRYQWRKNEVPVPGATSMSYSIRPATTADDGAQLSVMVSNSAGSTLSRVALLKVKSPARLSINASELNFGRVTVGTSMALPVTLVASGGEEVAISSVGVSGPGFNASSVPTGIILNPGQGLTVNVIFAPAAVGNAIGSLPITSNATGSPTIVSLSGSGVEPVSYSAVLKWTESSSSVVGYCVYRGTTSGGPYVQIDPSMDLTTSFTDTNVEAGKKYYYVLTSINSSGVESKYSSEVSAAIPAP